MSGAPVLFGVEDRLLVAGVVLGVDTVTFAGVPQSVGIAMIADEILDVLGEPLLRDLDFSVATYGPST